MRPGPKPQPEPLRRRHYVTARLSRQEKTIIKETAHRLGLTVNALVYQLCMEKAKQVGVFVTSGQSRD